MIVGFIVGITRMVLDFTYPSPSCGQEDTRPAIIKSLLFHYFYVALLLFAISLIVCIVVSLLTSPPRDELVSFKRIESARSGCVYCFREKYFAESVPLRAEKKVELKLVFH